VPVEAGQTGDDKDRAIAEAGDAARGRVGRLPDGFDELLQRHVRGGQRLGAGPLRPGINLYLTPQLLRVRVAASDAAPVRIGVKGEVVEIPPGSTREFPL
jgi:hypothetical protein